MILIRTATAGRSWRATERTRAVPYVAVSRLAATRFRAERKAIVAAFRDGATASVGAIGVEQALIEARADWMRLYERVYSSVGRDFARDAYNALTAGRALSGIDVRAGVVDRWLAAIREVVATEGAAKVRNITDVSRDRLRVSIGAGIDAGEGMEAIARRIDGLYENWTRNRSMVIARTEVVSASNLGGRAGALATDLDLWHDWLSTRDSRTRTDPYDHMDADGQRRDAEESYEVSGERLLYPGDTSRGASAGNTIRCRCTETWEPKS
jgi:hypothetical protein